MNINNYIHKDKILRGEINRYAYSRDASIYRLVPESVVRPRDESDIQQLFKYAITTKKSITFRASGTSLSGQTVTNGIIAEIAYDWQGIKVAKSGKSILLQPGVIGEHANQKLIKYKRRIGPDPASIKAARIGGIIANNASGMTTGKPCNSYNTLKYIRLILANGNIYDTSHEVDYNRFLEQEKELADGLIAIKEKINNSDVLRNKILDKYRIKNTIGYSLNSFLEFDHPLDIFAHLQVGSEGTLAFISNIELETVHDPPYKSTGLVLFPSIVKACKAIKTIKETGVKAIELMDNASLKTAKYIPNAPYDVNSLPDGSSALLCEFQEDDDILFDEMEKNLRVVIDEYDGEVLGRFEREENERLKLWSIRKSLFTTVGSLRKPGTSVITEDICFDIDDLSNVITTLHQIFKKWKFNDAVIFGHAKDGNLHFNLSVDLESSEGVRKYRKMLDEVVKMTVEKYNGSLKAEHGTGRNMAPFVKYEWGSVLYEIMWKIKELADPANILNPGVVLNKNTNIHIEDLKSMPIVHDEIDLCVECGFCEPVCPSRGFTFTPRQRISVIRELQLMNTNKIAISRELSRDNIFHTEMTCAVDGMCELVCPVNVNTGKYVTELRYLHNSEFSKLFAHWVLKRFGFTVKSVRFATKVMYVKTKLLGSQLIEGIFSGLNKISHNHLPAWNSRITSAAKFVNYIKPDQEKDYIYYPSCISRAIGADSNGQSLIEVIHNIANLAGVKLTVPTKIEDTCCSTAFSSKGFRATSLEMFERTIELLFLTSNGGDIPIVVDISPCTYKFLHPEDDISEDIRKKWEVLKFIDIIPFLNNITKDNTKQPLDRRIVIHPTCSTHKMEHLTILENLAKRCAKQVIIPDNSSCCGFAGDRGMFIPQLTKNAAQHNKAHLSYEQRQLNGYSSSRMCEIGMSDKDQCYRSIALLVQDYLKIK